MAYGLGWVLYWACLMLAGLVALYAFAVPLMFLLAVLLLYGLGLTFRHVLSEE